MLATYVALHDITDVEGFVAATIVRSGLRLTETEHEDLLAEGLCILYELAERFEPQRPGYEQVGRFSGFAAQFLPRRLGDAWHQRHPEHRRLAGEDGKRHWRYHPTPLSLEGALNPQGQDGNGAGDGFEVCVRPREHWAAVAPD